MAMKIEYLINKYKLKKSQIEKEYSDLMPKEKKLIKGCCAMADVKARMDEIQKIYNDLLSLKQN